MRLKNNSNSYYCRYKFLEGKKQTFSFFFYAVKLAFCIWGFYRTWLKPVFGLGTNNKLVLTPLGSAFLHTYIMFLTRTSTEKARNKEKANSPWYTKNHAIAWFLWDLIRSVFLLREKKTRFATWKTNTSTEICAFNMGLISKKSLFVPDEETGRSAYPYIGS